MDRYVRTASLKEIRSGTCFSVRSPVCLGRPLLRCGCQSLGDVDKRERTQWSVEIECGKRLEATYLKGGSSVRVGDCPRGFCSGVICLWIVVGVRCDPKLDVQWPTANYRTLRAPKDQMHRPTGHKSRCLAIWSNNSWLEPRNAPTQSAVDFDKASTTKLCCIHEVQHYVVVITGFHVGCTLYVNIFHSYVVEAAVLCGSACHTAKMVKEPYWMQSKRKPSATFCKTTAAFCRQK